MTKPNIDDLLLQLRAQNQTAAHPTLEQRVWSRIASEGEETASTGSRLFGATRLSWRLSAGAVAFAAGVGFFAATLAPPVAVARPLAIESWMSPDAPLAPSTILGG
ncbi:MAG: hypothetical protein RL145_1320 [Pseudomonadota bacterium]|jgi:hypothetical protein